MIAWVGEATWIERRLRFVDVRRQWAKVCAESSRSFFRDAVGQWQDVEEASRFRYAGWVGARGFDGPRHAPPLRMRLRCWYEVVIATAKGRRTVLREEGLRGDDARTAGRAIGRWRERQGKETGEPVAVREFRIARGQSRLMPADGQANRAGTAAVAGLGAVLPNADEPDDVPVSERPGFGLCRDG